MTRDNFATLTVGLEFDDTELRASLQRLNKFSSLKTEFPFLRDSERSLPRPLLRVPQSILDELDVEFREFLPRGVHETAQELLGDILGRAQEEIEETLKDLESELRVLVDQFKLKSRGVGTGLSRSEPEESLSGPTRGPTSDDLPTKDDESALRKEAARALSSGVDDLQAQIRILRIVIEGVVEHLRNFPGNKSLDPFKLEPIKPTLPPLNKRPGPNGSLDLDQLGAQLASLREGPLSEIEAALALIQAQGAESAGELEHAYLSATESIEGAFGDMFEGGKFNFDKLEGAAVGALDGILGKVAEILDQELFKGLFGKLFGGGGGLFGDLLGGVGKLFGFAGGGAVQPGGPVLVGERGPEIFVPPSAGSIIPNSGIGRGGQPVIVNMTNRFDVGLESVDSRIAQAAAPIAAQAVAAIEEARERDFR